MSDTSTVIHRPDPEHHCNIGWELRPLPLDHLARSTGSTHYYVHAPNEPAGTIRQCAQCGKTWVAYPPPRVYSGAQSVSTQWRPEGRIERWRRERRSRAGGS